MLIRVVTGVVGLPLVVGIIAVGNVWVFAVFLGLLTFIGLVEYFHMAFGDQWGLQVIGVAAGLVVAYPVLIQPELAGSSPVLALTFAILFLVFLFTRADLQKRYQELGVTVIGVLYLGYLFPHFAVLYGEGKEWVLWVLFAVFAGDTLAYVVGMAVGRRKLYPEVSPGKTVAGAMASLGGTVVAGAVAGQWLLGVPLAHLILLSIVLSVFGQAGDLFESWIKRTFASKDAGFIIPGHGGLMDRLDSLIFPGVVSTYYVRFLNS
jgi:phosphatidate cytidylyltransferase